MGKKSFCRSLVRSDFFERLRCSQNPSLTRRTLRSFRIDFFPFAQAGELQNKDFKRLDIVW